MDESGCAFRIVARQSKPLKPTVLPKLLMPSNLKPFFQRWAINTLAVLVAAHLVKGIRYDTVGSLFAASLLLGIFNSVLRPIMLLLSLPLLIFTLGMFTLVINGLLLYFVGWLVGPFYVDSFGAAFWGGLVISVVSLLANLLLGTGQIQVEVDRKPKPPSGNDEDGDGPIIDV